MIAQSMMEFLRRKLVFIALKLIYEIKVYFIGAYGLFEDFYYMRQNKTSIYSKSNETAIVTGGARGIGVEVVKKLLQCDMHVIIACRNVGAGKSVLKKIREEGIITGIGSVFQLDLASFKSIDKFAKSVKETCSDIDILINNAGIMDCPYEETEDGYESQWQVNYLGSFYLTHLLMPLLEAAESARIVNVSSIAHLMSPKISFDDINMKACYSPLAAYAKSKLAQILFSIELDKRLQLTRSKVRVLCVHPGIVYTDIFEGTLMKMIFGWLLKFAKNAEQGAITVLHAAISLKLTNQGGIYISNCREIKPSSMARDDYLQEKLFHHCCDVFRIENFGRY